MVSQLIRAIVANKIIRRTASLPSVILFTIIALEQSINGREGILLPIDGRPFGVYAMPAARSVCGNSLLLRDWGLIPWAFRRVYGCRAVVVFGKTGEYPYREAYLKGIEAEFLTTEREQIRTPIDFVNRCLNFIYKNYQQMDMLLFYGLGAAYLPMAGLYKQMRSDGKIWLNLAADTQATDQLTLMREENRRFLNHCDLITTESMEMRRMLSQKWRRPIGWAPSGFCTLSGNALEEQSVLPYTRYEEKENIILTAGRIAGPGRERTGREGGGEWKGGHPMLAAFVLAAEKLPGWQLHILGPVEGEARPALRGFFEKYPGLSKRIRLIETAEEDGSPFSRPLFWEECRRAKIFAYGLREIADPGGNGEECSDVFCEAALRGCFSVTGRPELTGDLTPEGAYGIGIQNGGPAEIAGALMEICGDEARLQRTCEGVQTFVRAHYDYERIVRKAVYQMQMDVQTGEVRNV